MQLIQARIAPVGLSRSNGIRNITMRRAPRHGAVRILELKMHRFVRLAIVALGLSAPAYAGFSPSAALAADKVVDYACGGGAPMQVRYHIDDYAASVSHDGLPEIRLKQVVSGSGIRYSNGYFTLSSKADLAALEWDETRISCASVSVPDMEWHHAAGDDTNPPSIGVSVPETDNAMVDGRCRAGQPDLTFGAAVGGKIEGAPLDIEFFAEDFRRSYSGVVSGTRQEQGVGGVAIDLPVEDPLWATLKRRQSIAYRSGGHSVTLPLKGSASAIGGFLRDCEALAERAKTNGSPAPPEREVESFDPLWTTCEMLAVPHTELPERPVSVKFVNATDAHRGVLVIGPNGQPEQRADLDPGQSLSAESFFNQLWMFTDGPGNCLEMYRALPGVELFKITARNGYFGPE
ncbi:MliC family protein [Mesorhizobium sp. 10J20-29]